MDDVGGFLQRLARNDAFWIGSQLLIFGSSAAAGIRNLRTSEDVPFRSARSVGLLPVAAALVVAERARRDLGKNITIAPTPVRDGRLVDSGVYGVVRHPMYLSATLAMLGWAIFSGARLALAAVPIGVAFFNAKARHEERLLAGKYADYDEYRRRVPARLFPALGKKRRS